MSQMLDDYILSNSDFKINISELKIPSKKIKLATILPQGSLLTNPYLVTWIPGFRL